MRIIAWDTETHLIAPGLLAPPLVCLQWLVLGEAEPHMVSWAQARAVFESWLDDPDTLIVGHNVAYDTAVMAAEYPEILPKIFRAYEEDRITDTLLRDKLGMLAMGTYRMQEGEDGEFRAVNYALSDLAWRHLGVRLAKEDTYRLRYNEFRPLEGHTSPDCATWPEEARVYALKDAEITLAIYQAQEVFRARWRQERAPEVHLPTHLREAQSGDVFADQFRRARAAFALHLSSCWGMITEDESVSRLEVTFTQEFEDLKASLQAEGIIRADGTADTKRAEQAMVAACEAEGLAIPKTKTGKVSLAAGVCERFEDFTTIGRYSRYLTVRKTLSNDIELLRKGVEYPVQPRYDLADSGRTTCSKPNIQALNRGAGIRECFIPREGSVFIAADFSALELHTRAVWCLEVLGYSKLAETLNASIDAHLQMAARMLNIPYEEAKTRKAEPFIKEARQRAKAINFGRPGGLGDAKFVQYAKASYGVTLSQEEAAQSKKDWLADQPEVIDFFRLASEATSNPSGLAQETSLFTERTVGATRYSALCNRRFQGLGADAALQALWLVTRACYIDRASPLYGWHVVAFVHDEIICEGPEARAHEALGELEALMQRGANTYLSRVPTKTEGVCMRRWSKNAKLLRDATGRVIPWDVEVS